MVGSDLCGFAWQCEGCWKPWDCQQILYRQSLYVQYIRARMPLMLVVMNYKSPKAEYIETSLSSVLYMIMLDNKPNKMLILNHAEWLEICTKFHFCRIFLTKKSFAGVTHSVKLWFRAPHQIYIKDKDKTRLVFFKSGSGWMSERWAGLFTSSNVACKVLPITNLMRCECKNKRSALSTLRNIGETQSVS